MKKILYYMGRFVLAPIAIILLVTLGFPAPVLPAVLLVLAITILMAKYPSPKIEKVVASITIIALCAALISLTIGSWGYKKFKQNFPIMAGTMPRSIFGLDLQGAAKIDPAMAEAKLKLLLLQREKEQELANLVEKKINEGRWEEAIAIVKRWQKNREAINETISPRDDVSGVKVIPAVFRQPILQIPGKTLIINLEPNEIYIIDDNVKQGQSWKYLSFNGAFSHRINKGDDKACWGLVDNNLPWNADWSGKLEVMAGNTPVTLTVNII